MTTFADRKDIRNLGGVAAIFQRSFEAVVPPEPGAFGHAASCVYVLYFGTQMFHASWSVFDGCHLASYRNGADRFTLLLGSTVVEVARDDRLRAAGTYWKTTFVDYWA